MPQRFAALTILEQAMSRSGGAKVMLRPDEAAMIRAVLKGEPAIACGLIDDCRPCHCGLADPLCEHRLVVAAQD